MNGTNRFTVEMPQVLCARYLFAGGVASALAGRASWGHGVNMHLHFASGLVYAEGAVLPVVSAGLPKRVLYAAYLVLLDAAKLDAIIFIDPEP